MPDYCILMIVITDLYLRLAYESLSTVCQCLYFIYGYLPDRKHHRISYWFIITLRTKYL